MCKECDLACELGQAFIKRRLDDLLKEKGLSIIDVDKLNISFMNLTEIPPEIGNLQNLETLWCNKNQLTSLFTAPKNLNK